jgi:hypothetical protein
LGTSPERFWPIERNPGQQPELELEPSEAVADAVLTYRFDADTGEHVIGLVEPLSYKPRP